MFKHSLQAKEEGKLLNLVMRELPLLPGHAAREALKRRDVKVNGVRVQENISLQKGDYVELFTPVPEREIPLVYEDEDCLIVIKPVGLNTDSNLRSAFSLLSWARARFGNEVALVHRLDNQTSGLIILAKTGVAENMLKDLFKSRQVVKQYQCLVSGKMQEKKAVLTAYLQKDAMNAKVRVTSKPMPDSLQIVTEYKVMEEGEVSRLLVTLHTGRTHQIRAHLSFLGHPVLGDEVYGDREFNRKHKSSDLKLCATALYFDENCPLTGIRGKRFETTPQF